MRVYEITPRKDLRHVAYPTELPKDLHSLNVKETVIGNLQPKSHEMIVDYWDQPVRLISDQMKEVLCAHDATLYTTLLWLKHPNDSAKTWRYWLMQPKFHFLLHEKTTFDSMGTVKSLILDSEAVKYTQVFSIFGLSEQRWFVTLRVLESLLRHGVTGFAYQEVRVDESTGKNEH